MPGASWPPFPILVSAAPLAAVPAQAPVQLPGDGIGTPAPPRHPHTSPGCREVAKPGWRLGGRELMGLGPGGQHGAGLRQTKPPARPVGTRRCRLRAGGAGCPRPHRIPSQRGPRPYSSRPRPGGAPVSGEPTRQPRATHSGVVTPPDSRGRGQRRWQQGRLRGAPGPKWGGHRGGSSPTRTQPSAGTVPTPRPGLTLMGFTVSSPIPLKIGLGRGGSPPRPPTAPPLAPLSSF